MIVQETDRKFASRFSELIVEINSQRPSNPFATRWVRPDAAPFVGRQSFVDTYVDNFFALCESGKPVGQIVGPHGCGKTTLTIAMETRLRTYFQDVSRITIHDKAIQRRRCDLPNRHLFTQPTDRNPRLAVSGNSVNSANDLRTIANSSRILFRRLLIVDGFERLNFINRFSMIGWCRRNRCGLLLTTHRHLVGVPVVKKLSPTLNRFQEIVATMVARQPHSTAKIPGDKQIKNAYLSCEGNYREALMCLFDEFESANDVSRK